MWGVEPRILERRDADLVDDLFVGPGRKYEVDVRRAGGQRDDIAGRAQEPHRGRCAYRVEMTTPMRPHNRNMDDDDVIRARCVQQQLRAGNRFGRDRRAFPLDVVREDDAPLKVEQAKRDWHDGV